MRKQKQKQKRKRIKSNKHTNTNAVEKRVENRKVCDKESCLRHYGGYSVGVPPLPIPNREVKPVRADGTAYSGRVGSRRPFKSKHRFGESISSAALLFAIDAAPTIIIFEV